MLWGIVVPAVALGGAPFTFGLSIVAAVLLYAVLAARVYRRVRLSGWSRSDSAAYGVHCMAAKVPQGIGLIRYHYGQATGTAPKIIEHKRPEMVRVKQP